MSPSKTSLLVLALFGVLLTGLPCNVSASEQWGSPMVEAVPTPSPPSVGAATHVLVDMHSGHILSQDEAKKGWKPASLAKLMTAYVVFKELDAGHIDLDDQVEISENAWRATGSRMFLEVGSKVAVGDLLQGLIVQSGNDAAIALAEHVAGDSDTFAQLMNQYADRLGMDNTHYTNPTGMPDEQMHTTALDTARLARRLIEDFPEFYEWYSQRSFEYAGIEQHNRNSLLWRDETVDGLKTGYTEAAGYNLATSAKRDGMRLISVVLGTESEDARAQQSLQLLNYGFRFFETHRLYSGGKQLSEAKVWKGETEAVGLGLREDLYVTIPRREYKNLDASISVDGQIVAPIAAGEVLGTMKVRLADTVIDEAPLAAMSSVEEGGLWRRTIDQIWLRFQ